MRLVPALTLSLLASFLALASPARAAGATGELIARQGAGAAPACQACHGVAGEGNAAAGFPRLAGLPKGYLRRQLTAFAEGQRANAVMQPIAQALSNHDREAVAAWYAGLRAPAAAPASPAPAAIPATAAWLAANGRWSDRLPACDQCHAPGGRGVGEDFPPLAGQPAAYLSRQLHAWQQGIRPPGPMGLMAAVAAKLTDDDIEGLSAHFAALGDGATPAAKPGPATAPASANRATAAAAHTLATFEPPPESAIPDNDFGQMIRRGREIFTDTPRAAAGWVGNTLRCSSCHLDAGRLADSAPLWAAWVSYPAYRAKTREVNTYEQRLQGCFQYSMNGTAPPPGDPVLVALQTYSYWLASGARVDPKMAGRGYPPLPKAAQAPDAARGAKVYAQRCQLCHGADGAGQRTADGHAVFPALWGADSFNWGAGMGNVSNAAAFIRANMPLGLGGTLSEQDAWDVARYMDAHERPQDPRYAVSAAETRRRHHDTPDSLYGLEIDGHVLGDTGPPRRR